MRARTSCACAYELRVLVRACARSYAQRVHVRGERVLPAAELFEPGYLDGDVLSPLLRVREHDERLLGLPERAMEPHERFDEPWGRARRGEGLVLESGVVQSLRERAAACGDYCDVHTEQ